MLEKNYSINNTTCYPNIKGETLSLLASLPNNTALIVMHEVSYPDYDSSYNEITECFEEHDNSEISILATRFMRLITWT